MILNYPSWWSSLNSDLWSLRGQIFTQVNIIPAFAGAFLDMGGVCRFLTDSQLSGEQKRFKYMFNTDAETVMYFLQPQHEFIFISVSNDFFCWTQKEAFCRMVTLLFSLQWKSIIKSTCESVFQVFWNNMIYFFFFKKLKFLHQIERDSSQKMKFLTSFTHLHVVPNLWLSFLCRT